MANFETIKTTIDANINTNGNQAITGAVMNSVLKQMVDSTDTELAKLSEEVFTPSTNLFNPATALKDTGISSTNGNAVTLTGYVASDFIPVNPATDYTFKGRYIVAWYDKNKVFIVGDASETKTNKSPDNAAYTRFSFKESGYNVNLMMVNEGSELLPFEEYKLQFNPKYLEDVELLKEKLLGYAYEYADNAIVDFEASIFDKVSSANLFNPNEVEFDKGISSATGDIVSLNNMAVSGYIPIKPNTEYTFKTRYVVVWFDKDKNYVSASGSAETAKLTLTAPSNAAFVRFSYNYVGYNTDKMQMNEGNVLLSFEPYQEPKNILKPELYAQDKQYKLLITTIKEHRDDLQQPNNLCLIATRCINEKDKEADYDGYLYLDVQTDKLYYSSGTPYNPIYLCDWKAELAEGLGCERYGAIITPSGDIVFLKDHYRSNPIIYPANDYSNPYVVDFGANKKPYGFLMGGSVVVMKDGSFLFGDYAYHSIEDENNNDGRIIWRVSYPYNNPQNWVKAHTFKHVNYTSPLSNEPNNEIGHIHAINYDWYTDTWYCTTGDIDRHCRLWYSKDGGITWNPVEGAVGATSGNDSLEGQKWRFTNMIFMKEAIYWCTDSFYAQHNLWKVLRDSNGVVDAQSLEKVINLEVGIPSEYSQATYVTTLLRNPNGLLIIDRAEPRDDGKLDIKFYSFDDRKLHVCHTFHQAETNVAELENARRIGIPNQTSVLYQPQVLDGAIYGGGRFVRPNNTALFNNTQENYVGTMILKVFVA